MGVTFVDGNVTGPTGIDAQVRFLVDSGAQYTMLPELIWRALQLEPVRRQRFQLADGRLFERAVAECELSIPQGRTRGTPVVLGEVGEDQALLGVVTLEQLGVVLHPFSRQILPMQALMM
jgi:clan AA aspartic protease